MGRSGNLLLLTGLAATLAWAPRPTTTRPTDPAPVPFEFLPGPSLGDHVPCFAPRLRPDFAPARGGTWMQPVPPETYARHLRAAETGAWRDLPWADGIDEAIARARREDKPVLVTFFSRHLGDPACPDI